MLSCVLVVRDGPWFVVENVVGGVVHENVDVNVDDPGRKASARMLAPLLLCHCWSSDKSSGSTIQTNIIVRTVRYELFIPIAALLRSVGRVRNVLPTFYHYGKAIGLDERKNARVIVQRSIY